MQKSSHWGVLMGESTTTPRLPSNILWFMQLPATGLMLVETAVKAFDVLPCLLRLSILKLFWIH